MCIRDSLFNIFFYWYENFDTYSGGDSVEPVSYTHLLIEIHLADVAEIAKLYAGQGVLLEDLVGEGNLALS